MRDKDQKLIFTKDELDSLKKVFADNDELLYAVRAVLLQFPLTKRETSDIKVQITPRILRLLKKKMLPDVGPEFPLAQLPDLRSTLEGDLKTKAPEEMAPLFAAKQLEIDYLAQQFTRLADIEAPFEEKLRLEDMKKLTGEPYDVYVGNTARNFILGFVDNMLLQVKSLAGEKDETPEQRKARLERNSAQ